MKFVVTTRKETLEALQSQGYVLIGVDGTVPKAQHLYDYLFDHHRPDGAAIQLDEMETLGFDPREVSSKLCFVTTQVDADAIAAAFRIKKAQRFTFRPHPAYNNDPEKYRFLQAISYECDHIGVPNFLNAYADPAAMVVAALKEESETVVQQLGLSANRHNWSLEDQESYAAISFERGVDCIERLLEHYDDSDDPLKWDYRAIAQPYWQTVQANTQQIIAEKRITQYRDCLIFNQVGMTGYIDPRCWIRASHQQGIYPHYPITVTQREVWQDNEFKGYAYTLGTIPLHPRQKDFDYTGGVFDALTKAERDRNPNADGWGGRATVGGSGWNTPSLLTPQEVIDIVLSFDPR